MVFYEFEGRRPRVGEGSYVSPDAVVIGDVRIGRGCYIAPGAVIKGDYGRVEIGDESNVQDNCILHARPDNVLRIGNRVSVGHGAILHNCTIEDDVTVGMGAVVSDFAVVGRYSVVAEGAVVTNNQKVPESVVVAGIPARKIADVDTKERERYLGYKMLYSRLADRYARSSRRVPSLEQLAEPTFEGLIPDEGVVLVVVDMQEKLFKVMVEKERLCANVLRLIRFAKAAEIPIVVTEQYPKGLGRTIEEVKAELPEGIEVIEKVSFGCFGEERFVERLKELDAESLIVCGIEAHICVGQTVFAAPSQYKIYLVVDAVSAFTETDKEVAVERAKMCGAVPVTTEMIMFEYLKVAKTEKFERCLDVLRREGGSE